MRLPPIQLQPCKYTPGGQEPTVCPGQHLPAGSLLPPLLRKNTGNQLQFTLPSRQLLPHLSPETGNMGAEFGESCVLHLALVILVDPGSAHTVPFIPLGIHRSRYYETWNFVILINVIFLEYGRRNVANLKIENKRHSMFL